jgi:hypothetical protein
MMKLFREIFSHDLYHESLENISMYTCYGLVPQNFNATMVAWCSVCKYIFTLYSLTEESAKHSLA